VNERAERSGPLVSVLVPTFNRRRWLAEALQSLCRQTYPHFEAFVVNDGGEPVGDLIAAMADPRLVCLDRRENRGKAASLNEALARAAGKYVAYLDDDDLYYPRHLERLVETLEGDTDCGAAYTDLYKVHCRLRPDGRREALGKVVTVSRDFDRFFLCYFNLALHVSLMHRRDLLDRTGPYREDLVVMIDWDMTRRLGFFTDFRHVPEVTGEFYGPIGANDRLSYRMRLDREGYVANQLKIRSTRPPKPWPKMPDLSIVLATERLDEAAAQALRQVYAWTFMPYQVYLVLGPSDAARFQADLPNLVQVPVPEGAALEARIDAALARLDGDYVAIVPPHTTFGPLWVEDALHAALGEAGGRTAFLLSASSGWPPGLVVEREALRRARLAAPRGLLESLRAAGLEVRAPHLKERALAFDRLLQEAEAMEADGNFIPAAWIYRRTAEQFGNARWMLERAARALGRAGASDAEALDLCRQINRQGPTVSSLLLEAQLHKRADRFDRAIALLEEARRALEGKGQTCN
jgi:glycosyltransferase involved in cell wall biosynthesis